MQLLIPLWEAMKTMILAGVGGRFGLKDFVKQFRLIFDKGTKRKGGKEYTIGHSEENNGKEGMFDMFMQRPNTLKRILEKKTIDGNVVDRLKQQITDWIIYEEEKKRKWLASTLPIQTRSAWLLSRFA